MTSRNYSNVDIWMCRYCRSTARIWKTLPWLSDDIRFGSTFSTESNCLTFCVCFLCYTPFWNGWIFNEGYANFSRYEREGADATLYNVRLSIQVYLGVFGSCLSRHLRLFYQKVACCRRNGSSGVAREDAGGGGGGGGNSGKKASRRVRKQKSVD